MGANPTFLNGEFKKEGYIEKPNDFSLLEDKDMVCRSKKALYGIKKSPRTNFILSKAST